MGSTKVAKMVNLTVNTGGHNNVIQAPVAPLTPSYEFTTEWHETRLHYPQWQRLVKELSGKPVRVLEIGLFEGRSTTWLLENVLKHPKCEHVGIDTFEGGIEHKSGVDLVNLNTVERRFYSNVAKSGKAEFVNVMKGYSYDCLVQLNKEKCPPKFDAIYVDGSHNAEDVLADAVLAWRLLKLDGIMIFDDYELNRYEEAYNNPKLAIDSFMECHKFEIEVLHKNYQICIRKISKDRPLTARYATIHDNEKEIVQPAIP